MPESLLHPIAFAIGLAIVVYLHVVLGEMVPKNIALAGPDRAALVLGPPIWAIVTVLRPVIVVINAIATAILRLVGVELRDEVSSTYTREEVAALVEESRGEGLLEADEYDRLAGALGFTEKTVADGADADRVADDVLRRGSTAADVEALCAAPASAGSRSPTDDGELLGYLHIKDVLETDEARRQRAGRRQVDPAVRARCQPTTRCTTRSRRCSAAAPTWRGWSTGDGVTLGLATLEDVIEELVGEIRDAAHLDDSA